MSTVLSNGAHETELRENSLTVEVGQRVLILHNDDYNTFDHVIESLIDICGHYPEQAEQCAWITHFNGKCDVKKGPRDVLEDMYKKLKMRGLTVTLED